MLLKCVRQLQALGLSVRKTIVQGVKEVERFHRQAMVLKQVGSSSDDDDNDDQ